MYIDEGQYLTKNILPLLKIYYIIMLRRSVKYIDLWISRTNAMKQRNTFIVVGNALNLTEWTASPYFQESQKHDAMKSIV